MTLNFGFLFRFLTRCLFNLHRVFITQCYTKMQIFVDLHFLLKLIIFYEHKPVDIDQIKTFYFQKNFKDGSNTKAQMEERIY